MTGRVPRRVRVGGDLFHPAVPDGAVYIGRQAPHLRRSVWANPFKAGRTTPANWSRFGGIHVRDQAHAVDLYRQLLDESPGYQEEAVEQLAGRDLACWCKLEDPCHGRPLLLVANPGLVLP